MNLMEKEELLTNVDKKIYMLACLVDIDGIGKIASMNILRCKITKYVNTFKYLHSLVFI